MSAEPDRGAQPARTRWEQLAARARQEPAPAVDVTQRVLATIARRPAPWQTEQRTLLLCALGSLAAAGIVATLAAGWWSDLGDPLLDLLQSLNLVLR